MCALPVGVFAEDKEISTQILTLSPSAGALGIFVYVGVIHWFSEVRHVEYCNCTRSSAIAEGPRDALCQLK